MKKNKSRSILLLFLGFKIILLLFILCCYDFLPFSQWDYENNSDHFIGQNQEKWEKGLSPYDSPHYLNLAYFGYENMGYFDEKVRAFFPLYPTLISLFSFYTGRNYTVAGLLVSFFAHLAGVLMFYRLVRLDWDSEIAFESVKSSLIYPTAFFFLAVYTESLFFLISVTVFYFLRKKRWWLAALAAFLGGLCRPNGILLAIPFAIEYLMFFKDFGLRNWKSFLKENYRTLLTPAAAPLGTCAYFSFLYFTTGNFFAYFEAIEWWGRKSISLWNFLQLTWDRLIHFQELPLHGFYNSKIDFTFGLIFLLSILIFGKKLRPSYALYSLAIILLPQLNGQTMSLTRYLSVSFPHFILLGILSRKKPLVGWLVSLVSILFLSIFALQAYNWYWVG